jgi:hypothetical protein
MHILLLDLSLGLGAKSNFQGSALVIGAVRAGDQLLVLALEGEPGLEIVLLGGGVVQSTRDDGHDTVWNAKGLVEFLGVGDHVVKLLPGLLWVSEDELLDLLELMDTENTPSITAVRTSFSSVASGETSVPFER